MHRFTNRLIHEKSPYLLQHAHNPVDWHPWGEEAFGRAMQEDRPIFLSIGYATCHWCHVMEQESFENEAVADLLNEAFVCIKVDREERPDIDNIYMTACQMLTGQGGWPLTLIMTPDRKPFFAATYIPAEARFGRTGLKELVPRILDAWGNRREEVLGSVGQIMQMLSLQNAGKDPGRVDAKVLGNGYDALMKEYDPQAGGFGGAPKFPTPHKLIFLLRSGCEEGIRAAEHTLEAMRGGGLFDHIGYGFHRYSTDAGWLLPHFEKMLYDQALLALAYTEAYALTRKPFYREVVEEILTYVLRDMTAPEGGFYSAEDADSEGEEGLFYTWDAREMESALGEDYEFAAGIWNILPAGNFRDEASGRYSGRNIPHRSSRPKKADTARLERVRRKLFEIREKRIHPLKDTKILADWNGLMMAAFSRAGKILDKPEYIEAARGCNAFLEQYMCTEDGALWHRFRDGHTAVAGQLEDYAFVIWGLLELYEATLEAGLLDTALQYNRRLTTSFTDAENGGYFMTESSGEALIVRPKNIADGAVPSGNSVQMHNLLRLARFTGLFELEQEAGDVGEVFGGFIQRTPVAFAHALSAVQLASRKADEVVVVGRRDDETVRDVINYLQGLYRPGMTVLLKDGGDLSKIAPFTKSMRMLNGETTVYLCRNFACEQPIFSIEELRQRLG